MYDFYDYKKQDPIADIEYVRGMYEAQVHKVEQEEYMKNLLFADFVKKVKKNISRYDLMENIFKEAQSQIDKKKKKERERLLVLEEFMQDDFFDSNSCFKITRIVSGGYESYYWDVEFDGYGQTIRITIPNMKHIGIDNIKHAHDGKFAFAIKESECCWSVLKTSYKIKDVAECIKEYFQLDKVNEDDD